MKFGFEEPEKMEHSQGPSNAFLRYGAGGVPGGEVGISPFKRPLMSMHPQGVLDLMTAMGGKLHFEAMGLRRSVLRTMVLGEQHMSVAIDCINYSLLAPAILMTDRKLYLAFLEDDGQVLVYGCAALGDFYRVLQVFRYVNHAAAVSSEILENLRPIIFLGRGLQGVIDACGELGLDYQKINSPESIFNMVALTPQEREAELRVNNALARQRKFGAQ